MEAGSQQQQMPPPPTPPMQQQMPPPPQPPAPPRMGGGPPTSNKNVNSGRGGGRGGRGRGGGRTSNSGRNIVDVNNGGRGGRGGGRGGGPPNQQQQQGGQAQKISANSGVPFGHVPAYLPGSSSLVEELDQRIMIVLRDGRHLAGNLRTFDQYSNMVLDNASERRFHTNDKESGETNQKKITYFTDVSLGMYVVRGDSIVLLGQIGSEDEETADMDAQNSNAGSTVVMKRLCNNAFDDLGEEGADDADDDEELDASKSLEWDFDKDLLA